MNNFRGLRIITNTHCNYNCKFCYQKNKPANILDISYLKSYLQLFESKSFEYCTIMGGESTLLTNLVKYINIGSKYAKEVRLTTNGALLSPMLLKEYKEAGLTGLNISIATLEKYSETTRGGISSDSIINVVNIAKEFFPNLRINIALCEENFNNEIKNLIDLFVTKMSLNVTICEDILKTYTCVDKFEELLDSSFVENTGHGLLFLKHKDKLFGYYTHDDNYKDEDLIISPYGIDVSWTGFCEKVGLNIK